jgi:hypothetical protein
MAHSLVARGTPPKTTATPFSGARFAIKANGGEGGVWLQQMGDMCVRT